MGIKQTIGTLNRFTAHVEFQKRGAAQAIATTTVQDSLSVDCCHSTLPQLLKFFGVNSINRPLW